MHIGCFIQAVVLAITIGFLFTLIKNKQSLDCADSDCLSSKKSYLKFISGLLVTISMFTAVVGFMGGFCFDSLYVFVMYLIMILELDYLYFKDKKFFNVFCRKKHTYI